MKSAGTTFAAQTHRELTRTRLLPLDGEVLVRQGDGVDIDTVVARALIPGHIEIIPVASRLGISPQELERCLLVRDGEHVKAGQVLAEHRALWGLSRVEVQSPVQGMVRSHSNVTGTVVIEGHPAQKLLRAFVKGTVRRIIEKRGVVVEGAAGVVQAVVGVGPEITGPLVKLDLGGNNPKGSVVFIPGRLDGETMSLLVSQEVVGVVAASVHSDELFEFLGRPIDPASTVDVDTPLTLAFTEGFGDHPMSEPVSAVLEALCGRLVGLSGHTQIRSGAQRPELVAEPEERTAQQSSTPPRDETSLVRVVRGPDFGQLGRIVEEPIAPVEFDSGIAASAYVLALEDGKRLTVPRANTEEMVLQRKNEAP